jgi:hypothetical protein
MSVKDKRFFTLMLCAFLFGLILLVKGPSAYEKGASEAVALTYRNQVEQIRLAGAIYMQKSGLPPSSENVLVGPDLLSSIPISPSGERWKIDHNYAYINASIGKKNSPGNISANSCLYINERNEGGEGLVHCVKSNSVLASIDAALPPVAEDLTDGSRVVVFVKI